MFKVANPDIKMDCWVSDRVARAYPRSTAGHDKLRVPDTVMLHGRGLMFQFLLAN